MDDKKLCMTWINFLEKDKLHEQATNFFKANFHFWYTSGDKKKIVVKQEVLAVGV